MIRVRFSFLIPVCMPYTSTRLLGSGYQNLAISNSAAPVRKSLIFGQICLQKASSISTPFLSLSPHIYSSRLSFPSLGVWFTASVIAWLRILFRIITSAVIIIRAIAWAFGSGYVSGLLHWALSIYRCMHRTLSLQAIGDIRRLISLLLYIMPCYCR